MNAITGVPAAYRPRELGPQQRRWMEKQGWVDKRKVGAHVCIPLYDHGKRCWCGAQIEETPNAE